MRIRVDYSTTYDYSSLASDVVQLLHVEPGRHDGQHVLNWRINTDVDGRLRRSHDAFGNAIHMFYADYPLQRMTLHVTGEVDTSDVLGKIAGANEPLPPSVFLRSTALSRADDAIRRLAMASRSDDPLETCHTLKDSIYDTMAFDADVTHSHTDASHAYRLRAGVCQDYSHIFLGAARLLGIPARYVSGHLLRADGLVVQPAGHAWAEAWLPLLGWVGFDPTNRASVTDSYLRVAVGLDYLDAAPVRGARRGGGAETLRVSVTTQDGFGVAGGQAQRQSQS
jgi:transglutaminase-like putative cysteine protease